MACVLFTCCIIAFTAQIIVAVPHLIKETYNDQTASRHPELLESVFANRSLEVLGNRSTETEENKFLDIEDRIDYKHTSYNCELNISVMWIENYIKQDEALMKSFDLSDLARLTHKYRVKLVTCKSLNSSCLTEVTQFQNNVRPSCKQNFTILKIRGKYNKVPVYLPSSCSCHYKSNSYGNKL